VTVRTNHEDDLTDVNTKGAKRPRVGCFEVVVKGAKVLSLLGLKRPFPKLKALVMEDVAATVVKACGA